MGGWASWVCRLWVGIVLRRSGRCLTKRVTSLLRELHSVLHPEEVCHQCRAGFDATFVDGVEIGIKGGIKFAQIDPVAAQAARRTLASMDPAHMIRIFVPRQRQDAGDRVR